MLHYDMHLLIQAHSNFEAREWMVIIYNRKQNVIIYPWPKMISIDFC